MSKHSSIVGGSTAGRLLQCPGSYQAQLALPPSADIPSEYAEEGTAMHEVMAKLMCLRSSGGIDKPSEYLGDTFHDRALTSAHVDEMIQPALDALADLEGAHGGGFDVAGVELSSAFPGIPGAFGTSDLLLRSADTAILVDWKFGSGVPVKAVYEDPLEGDLVNPQLLFYATAAMASHRKLFKGVKTLVVAIVQPRADFPLSFTTVTRTDIKWFTEDLQNAVVSATDRDPPRTKGEWCRFAPCKINCPLWTGPLLDMTKLGLVPRTEPMAREVTPYAEYLARAKALVDIFAMFKNEVDTQLHAYLEDGGTVPGWALKRKVKQRQWVDANAVKKALKKLGFDDQDIWEKRLRTFKETDATAKRLGVKIPDELRVAPLSNETTVCPADDPAPKVEKALAIEQFRSSLQLLQSAKSER